MKIHFCRKEREAKWKKDFLTFVKTEKHFFIPVWTGQKPFFVAFLYVCIKNSHVLWNSEQSLKPAAKQVLLNWKGRREIVKLYNTKCNEIVTFSSLQKKKRQEQKRWCFRPQAYLPLQSEFSCSRFRSRVDKAVRNCVFHRQSCFQLETKLTFSEPGLFFTQWRGCKLRPQMRGKLPTHLCLYGEKSKTRTLWVDVLTFLEEAKHLCLYALLSVCVHKAKRSKTFSGPSSYLLKQASIWNHMGRIIRFHKKSIGWSTTLQWVFLSFHAGNAGDPVK